MALRSRIAKCSASWPDGDPGVAPQGAHRAGRRPHPGHRAGSRALGPFADPPGASMRWPAPKRWAATAPYVLQAALAACHARARRAAETDWPRIAALYDRLRVVAPSPVVDLNRAIVHSMAFRARSGPPTGGRDRRRRRPPPLCALAGGARRLSVPGRPTGRGAFRIPGCGRADPQRAGKGLSSRTGGRLRRPALNAVSEAPTTCRSPSPRCWWRWSSPASGST